MEPIFTPAELAEVHAYVAPFYAWAKVKDVLHLCISLAFLAWAVRPLYRWSEAAASGLALRLAGVAKLPVARVLPRALDTVWRGPGWGAALIFAVACQLAFDLLALPKAIYFDYFHAHAYGLSNYTPGGYAYDLVKAMFLASVGVAALTLGLFGLARWVRRWWLVLGVVAGLGMLIAPAFDHYKSQVWFDRAPLEAGPLRERITALMAKAEIEFSDVVVERTSRVSKELQAYFAGQGPTRAIVLNDVLVEKLKPDEVLAAVAHEAGHVHEPRWPRRVLSALGLLAFLYLCHRLMGLSAKRGWFGSKGYADARTLPLLRFALWAVTLAVTPASLAWSRANESAADEYALRLTRDPDAFRRMLITATRLNKFDPDPPAWITIKAMSHPPIAERLAHARAFKRQAAGGPGPSPSPPQP